MVEFWVLGTGELLHKEFFEFGVRDFIRRYAQCYFKFFDDVVSNLIGVFYTLGIQSKVHLDVIFLRDWFFQDESQGFGDARLLG